MSSSNSIRVGEELFNTAREEGALMSRSAAQQIEHRARLGAALEASGLTGQGIELLDAIDVHALKAALPSNGKRLDAVEKARAARVGGRPAPAW